jgi:hypothetical protein
VADGHGKRRTIGESRVFDGVLEFAHGLLMISHALIALKFRPGPPHYGPRRAEAS